MNEKPGLVLELVCLLGCCHDDDPIPGLSRGHARGELPICDANKSTIISVSEVFLIVAKLSNISF